MASLDLGLLDPEVIAKYISRRREDMDQCRQALVVKDFEAIGRIGHKLKGNGVTFGFPELSHWGEQLENAVASNNVSDLQKYVGLFEAWISNLKSEEPSA